MARAILLIRAGLAASLGLLVFRPEPDRRVSIGLAIAGLAAVAGFRPKWTAPVTSLGWLAAGGISLARGADWFGSPVRAVLYAILFAALAILGGDQDQGAIDEGAADAAGARSRGQLGS